MTDRSPAVAPPLAVSSSSSPAAGTTSRLLIAAAFGGLLGLSVCAGGCADDEHGNTSGATGDGSARITASHIDTSMTRDSFEAACDAAGGRMEDHPHCGGANSCKGMSYDLGTHVYTEHGCEGLNTCTGFSCVLPS
jgi:hypothetical protein